MSFLCNCPQCNALIAKDSVCPECNYAGDTTVSPDISNEIVEEFQRRKKIHNRNVGVSMAMKLCAGFLSLVTVMLWAMFIYRGNVIAFVAIGLLTVMSVVFGWVVLCSEKFYPVALHCPGCASRLDELGMSLEKCPSCSNQLIRAV